MASYTMAGESFCGSKTPTAHAHTEKQRSIYLLPGPIQRLVKSLTPCIQGGPAYGSKSKKGVREEGQRQGRPSLYRRWRGPVQSAHVSGGRFARALMGALGTAGLVKRALATAAREAGRMGRKVVEG